MFSILLTPLLMLLSVFGLSLLQHPRLSQSPSAATQALAASTTVSSTSIGAVVGQNSPRHTSSSTDEARDPASFAYAQSGLATGPHPRLTPTPAPRPETEPQVDFVVDTGSRILALMNAERAAEGLATLSHDARLASLARAHSADMLSRSYFAHDDPDGCSSSCRADAAGYDWTAIGENIYMTDGYALSSDKEASMVVDGWMKSVGHRANILGAKFTHTGVGVAASGGTVYITAVYAKPR